MSPILKKYLLIIPILVCLFFTYESYTQEAKQDTLSLIQNYQKEAEKASLSQDYENAILNLNKACDLVTPFNNTALKASVNLSFAEFHYNIHNYNKAASSAIKAIRQLKENEDKFLTAKAYRLYGRILTGSKEFQEAEKYLKDADKLYTEIKDEKHQILTLVDFGNFELEKGNPTVAINYFEAALPYVNANKLNKTEAFIYLREAESLLLLNNIENTLALSQAKSLLGKALDILEEHSFSNLKIYSYKISSLISIKEGNQEQATSDLNTYSRQKDSINIVYLNLISADIERNSNVGDLNEIIASQQDDIDKKQKSINFGKMTTGLSVALIIILSLLALSLFKNNNLRAKANDLLKDKNIELTLAKEKSRKSFFS